MGVRRRAADHVAMTTPAAANRLVLLPVSRRRDLPAPRVRRYRLARLQAGTRAPDAPRYAYLKRSHD